MERDLLIDKMVKDYNHLIAVAKKNKALKSHEYLNLGIGRHFDRKTFRFFVKSGQVIIGNF